MRPSDTLSIDLPEEQARYVDALVESGSYENAGEVLAAGIRALQKADDDAVLEAMDDEWLRDQVLPALDELEAHPELAISSEEMSATIQAHHQERVRQNQIRKTA
jgi:putative addiction module CopG family antidote